MGAVVWQLNDIWPVASWASIDYYGRWKALHYAEKRMFNPVMISCEEEGELTQRPFCILEPKELDFNAKLHVANETLKNVKGVVKYSVMDPNSNILRSGEIKVEVPALDGVWCDSIDLNEYGPRNMHLRYSFTIEGEDKPASENTVLFVAPKHYNFVNPNLEVSVEGDYAVVNSSAFAKNVYVEGVDGDIKLEDNFFDMERGVRKVKILSNTASKLRVISVYDIN